MRLERGSVSYLRLRGAGNVNKLQLPTSSAVNHLIIVGETCRTSASGWRCWRSWEGNG